MGCMLILFGLWLLIFGETAAWIGWLILLCGLFWPEERGYYHY